VGDGAMGFWAALEEVFPQTRHQRCWFHKMGNVLNALPQSLQTKAKQALQEIWMAATRAEALRAFEHFVAAYAQKYPKATEKLTKDRDALLAFYDLPSWLLRAYPHHQPDRIDICHRAPSHHPHAQLRLARDVPGTGLQAPPRKQRSRGAGFAVPTGSNCC